MKLYMAVTADQYELPIVVEETITELAKHFNMRPNTIESSISKKQSGKIRGIKFVKVVTHD